MLPFQDGIFKALRSAPASSWPLYDHPTLVTSATMPVNISDQIYSLGPYNLRKKQKNTAPFGVRYLTPLSGLPGPGKPTWNLLCECKGTTYWSEWGVSGGNTAKSTHELLAEQRACRALPFEPFVSRIVVLLKRVACCYLLHASAIDFLRR